MIRYLTESDIRKLLTMPLALEAMEQAHKALAEHRAIDLPRARIHLPTGTQHVLQAATELGYIGFKYYYTRPTGKTHTQRNRSRSMNPTAWGCRTCGG